MKKRLVSLGTAAALASGMLLLGAAPANAGVVGTGKQFDSPQMCAAFAAWYESLYPSRDYFCEKVIRQESWALRYRI